MSLAGHRDFVPPFWVHWLLSAPGSVTVVATGAAPSAGPQAAAPHLEPSDASDVWPITECGTFDGKGCAPTNERVDLKRPTFSDPTSIDNPLFPVSALESVVQVGIVDGLPFRSETTTLPTTGVVDWYSTDVPVVLSQYVGYLDGQITEVALDRYAQADDGSVWYLGEDVIDYRAGNAWFTEGTWLTGRDGPPAMVMPAHPELGDVFRVENVIGIVFEELAVIETEKTVQGPNGPVPGAIVVDELGVSGGHSEKTPRSRVRGVPDPWWRRGRGHGSCRPHQLPPWRLSGRDPQDPHRSLGQPGVRTREGLTPGPGLGAPHPRPDRRPRGDPSTGAGHQAPAAGRRPARRQRLGQAFDRGPARHRRRGSVRHRPAGALPRPGRHRGGPVPSAHPTAAGRRRRRGRGRGSGRGRRTGVDPRPDPGRLRGSRAHCVDQGLAGLRGATSAGDLAAAADQATRLASDVRNLLAG